MSKTQPSINHTWKTIAGAYWADRFQQYWLPALYTNGLLPPDLHVRLGLLQPINPNKK